jgi:hypothetical protein
MDDKELVALWQGQPLGESRVNMEQVIKQASSFQRTVRNRNLREYVAAAIIVVWAGVSLARMQAPLLVHLGGVCSAIGAIFVVVSLRRRGHAAGDPPLAASTSEVMRWHRAQLLRQRDLLSSVPRWYLAPFVPGMVLIILGRWLEHPEQWPRMLAVSLSMVLVGVAVALLNRYGARKLNQRIVALDRELDG